MSPHFTPRKVLTRRLALAAPALVLATPALAHSYRAGDLMIGHAWCLPSDGASTQAFMPLAVTGERGDSLTGATTPAAARVLFLPGQAAVARWDIVPRRPIGMRKDGPHLLLEGLTRRLATGDRVPLTLTFARNGAKEVEVWVEPAPYAG